MGLGEEKHEKKGRGPLMFKVVEMLWMECVYKSSSAMYDTTI